MTGTYFFFWSVTERRKKNRIIRTHSKYNLRWTIYQLGVFFLYCWCLAFPHLFALLFTTGWQYFFCMIGCCCCDCHCHKLDFYRVVSRFVYLNRNQFSKLSGFFYRCVALMWVLFFFEWIKQHWNKIAVYSALTALDYRDNW